MGDRIYPIGIQNFEKIRKEGEAFRKSSFYLKNRIKPGEFDGAIRRKLDKKAPSRRTPGGGTG